MVVPRPFRLLVLATATFPLFACSYECGVVSRTVGTGALRDASGAILATARVDLSDNLRPTYTQLSVGILGAGGSAGAPLKGHVTRARLVDQGGALIAEVPTGTETLYLDVVAALNQPLGSRSDYDRIRSQLLTRGARVVVDIDLPGREHVETTLADAADIAGELHQCRFN